jgi:hypothetical protein
LAPGRPAYVLRLIEGQRDRRPTTWVARLESGAFPLARPARARLQVSYRYGVESSYRLSLEAEGPLPAAFPRLEPRWERAAEADLARADPTLAPGLADEGWTEVATQRFLNFAATVAQRRSKGLPRWSDTKALEELRYAWSSGRDFALAPLSVKEALPSSWRSSSHGSRRTRPCAARRSPSFTGTPRHLWRRKRCTSTPRTSLRI